MNISFFELEDWEVPEVKKQLKGHKLSFSKNPISKAKLDKNTEILVVFIYSQVTEDIINRLPKLKAIVTMSTGFDHIDLDACNKQKIKVSNVPFYGENTVAEHTMALILSLSRRIPESIKRCREGHFSPKGLRGFDLKNKTLGIIGVGHIGSHVARMAKGFEMNILGYCRRKDKQLCKETGLKYTTLNTLLKKSNIITLHLPLNDKTKHIINKDAFKKMKKGVYIINTARGPLIDTKALIWALNNKIVKGAALDVLEEECHVKEEKQLLSKQYAKECDLSLVLADKFLIELDDVLVTPHNAFNSEEALLRILKTTLKNIKAFTKGRQLNKVQ